jgi:hypothetical protein
MTSNGRGIGCAYVVEVGIGGAQSMIGRIRLDYSL